MFTLRQASRRSWRIGQRHPCRVFYLYYRESMQARAMALMAQKLEASLALEGQFSAEGLAAMSADTGSLTMELAKSLVDNIPFGDAERVWEKLSMKQPATDSALTDDVADDFFLWDQDAVKAPGSRRQGGDSPAEALMTMFARQLDLFSSL